MPGQTLPLLSPKQVARALGVSESSLKRWCDQGLIKTVRTAGGHRKMATSEVLRYLRDHDLELASPELLGLPPASNSAHRSLTVAMPRLVDALLNGDEVVARQIVLDLYLAQHELSVIFDDVIATAFREIGNRWQCRSADIFQERRSCEITQRILFELRSLLPTPNKQWLAIGGTLEGDRYSLPTSMAELVLRDVGFDATSLGTWIPVSSFTKAIQQAKPALFWLSVSHIADETEFVKQFKELSGACEETALVVGGRAFTESLRKQLVYTAYCDNMQHLHAFAKTFYRSLKGPKRRQKAALSK